MAFDINNLAREFKDMIQWMLKKEHGLDIKNDIKRLIDNEKELDRNPDSINALNYLVKLVVTQSWYYKKPTNDDINRELNALNKFKIDFRTPQARDELIKLVERLAPQKIKERAKKNIQEVFKYQTIKHLTEELYKLPKQRKPKVLGEKGRDDYLREFGHWDRVPMDRHEMRFIIRTGIYHACSKKKKNDPLQKSSLLDSLTKFCSNFLKGYLINGIDLGFAPGIVDIFIWSFCMKDRYNICRSTPMCEECKLKKVCLYAIINTNTV